MIMGNLAYMARSAVRSAISREVWTAPPWVRYTLIVSMGVVGVVGYLGSL